MRPSTRGDYRMIETGDWDWINDITMSWSDAAPLLVFMLGSMVGGVVAYIKYLKINRCFIVQLPKE
mgnify:CR=1 FL=1